MHERWPHPSVVWDELRALRHEKSMAEQHEHEAFVSELKYMMTGNDKVYHRILRRRSMRLFTERMISIGERIIDELENGSASSD